MSASQAAAPAGAAIRLTADPLLGLLLSVLAGDRSDVESGSIELAPPTSVVGLLPQEPERSQSELVRE